MIHNPDAENGLLPVLNVDAAVRERYSEAARQVTADLCCPVSYDPAFLKRLPQEILERDYGCGDPSRYVAAGETVLDLGSGGGKICYIAAQVVGATGRVIGVDCNDDMLALARKYQPEMADKLGYANVEFLKGRIQDLALNLDLLDEYLRQHPCHCIADWLRIEEHTHHLRQTRPLVADATVDVIVSNCVLNLVRMADRRQLFAEMYRVLKPGGRAVISDIVSNATVPERLRNDPQLWSGCLSGAFHQDDFLATFLNAGFKDVEIVERQAEPWAVVEGIEFRSLTVRAHRDSDSARCLPGLPVLDRGGCC